MVLLEAAKGRILTSGKFIDAQSDKCRPKTGTSISENCKTHWKLIKNAGRKINEITKEINEHKDKLNDLISEYNNTININVTQMTRDNCPEEFKDGARSLYPKVILIIEDGPKGAG